MNEENLDVVCEAPVLTDTVDNVVQIFKNHEEELYKKTVDVRKYTNYLNYCPELFFNYVDGLVKVQKLDQKKWSLEADIDHLKRVEQYLELKKAEINDDITRLSLRNLAYQKEHTNLRNSITVVKFQIEKIKESIAVAKTNDLKALEDFEKAVDEITKNFRSGPVTYDRKILLENIVKEKEKRNILFKKLEEVNRSYEDFNRAKGLRVRKDENEELLHCVLPDSELSCFIEMTKTLDEVIYGIKNLAEDPKQGEKNSQYLDSAHKS